MVDDAVCLLEKDSAESTWKLVQYRDFEPEVYPDQQEPVWTMRVPHGLLKAYEGVLGPITLRTWAAMEGAESRSWKCHPNWSCHPESPFKFQ